jgi:hypothetical protein
VICKPMEMCVGACNAKDPGTVSPGPARKHNGNKVAALSVSAFSAIMAGFAGGFAQARSEAVPVDRQFPEGLEGLQVSATGVGPIRQGLPGTSVPVEFKLVAGPFQADFEAGSGIAMSVLPNGASMEPSEPGAMLFHGVLAAAGDAVLPESPVAYGTARSADPGLSGSQVHQTSDMAWDKGPGLQVAAGFPQPEILSGLDQASLNRPVIFEEMKSHHHDTVSEIVWTQFKELGSQIPRVDIEQAPPGDDGIVARKAEPEPATAATVQLEPNGFTQELEQLSGKPGKKDTPDASLPVFSLKIQTEQVQGRELKASVHDAQEVASTLAEAVKDGLPKTVEFRLDPPGLGKLTVVVSSRGDEVCVKFIASSYASHNVLANSQEALAQALSQRGLSLAGFFVDHGMAGQGHQPRYGSDSPGRPGKPAAYESVQEQLVIGEAVLSSSVLDYRV